MIQTQQRDEKPHFGPELDSLSLNVGHKTLFF